MANNPNQNRWQESKNKAYYEYDDFKTNSNKNSDNNTNNDIQFNSNGKSILEFITLNGFPSTNRI